MHFHSANVVMYILTVVVNRHAKMAEKEVVYLNQLVSVRLFSAVGNGMLNIRQY